MANYSVRDLFEDSRQVEQFLDEYWRSPDKPVTRGLLFASIDPNPMLQGELYNFDVFVIILTVLLVLYVAVLVARQYLKEQGNYRLLNERPRASSNVESIGMRIVDSQRF